MIKVTEKRVLTEIFSLTCRAAEAAQGSSSGGLMGLPALEKKAEHSDFQKSLITSRKKKKKITNNKDLLAANPLSLLLHIFLYKEFHILIQQKQAIDLNWGVQGQSLWKRNLIVCTKGIS